jgi:phosphoserine phosphatase RsbU/P
MIQEQAIQSNTANRLKKLIAANQALATVESLSELLPQLLHFAQEVTHAEASSILLYKPETETLEFTLAYNEQEGTAESIIKHKIELKLGEGIAGHVALTRESLIVADAMNDSRFVQKVDKVSGFQTRTILCAPILYQDELLGVVQVLNAKDKPFFDSEDLDILESFSHLAAVAMVRSRMLSALLQQERMQAQLDAASKIQQNFLPSIPDIGPGQTIFAVTKPAIFVGGDFYDLIPLADGSVLVCVADVSGKGLPAALIGATLWSRIRSLVTVHDMPGSLLGALNSSMYSVMGLMFATMVVCRYWPDSRKAVCSVAGHPPPLHVQHGRIFELQGLKGIPIGIDPNGSFSEAAVELGGKESVLFMTDGITEARNAQQDFYGEDRMLAVLKQGQGPWGKRLVADVEAFRGKIALNDDMTIVEICVET